MDKKEEKALKRVKQEIEKIDKNKNSVYFFVLDTKGNPNGNLQYIYDLAFIAKNEGYNVGMLYQSMDKKDEFVGVKDWLGEEYASIPHYDIAKNEVDVGPADILFIPEIFANVMNQTKKLPCKRIAIFQNYDYLVEQMPFAVQWGDFGIMNAITNSNINAELLKDIFPYVKTKIINPFIGKMFGTTSEPKKMIVNIVANDQEDINRIIKPFYWKYPSFKWVSFRDLRGFSKEQFAKALSEAAITVWIDRNSSFGYSALEAMKSGSIVIAKVPDDTLDWMKEEDEKSIARLGNCCIWFDDIHTVQKAIANVVRAWITDKVPAEIVKAEKETSEKYSFDTSKKEFIDYLSGVINERKDEMNKLVEIVEKNGEQKEHKENEK